MFIELLLLFFSLFNHNAQILADQEQKVPGLALFLQYWQYISRQLTKKA